MRHRTLLPVLLLLAACAHREAMPPAGHLDTAVPADHRWQRLDTEAFRGKQDDIDFVDARTGFYVNGQGRIFRTDDGGTRWRRVFEQPGTYFRAIGMVDSLHGFAGNIGTDYFPGVTDTQPLYETQDGGHHWSPVALPGPPVKGICAIDVRRIDFIDAGVRATRVMVHAAGRVGGPARLLRSLDGGRTWSNIDMAPWAAMIMDVRFFDAMDGVVLAASDSDLQRSHARILRTRDGGASWQVVYESTRPFEITWKLSFVDRDVGYATVQSYNRDPAASQQRVVRTLDGGHSWTELALVDDLAARPFGIGFATREHGWVGTAKGGYETHDGGATWAPIDFGMAVNKIRIRPAGSPVRAYAIGTAVHALAPPKHFTPVSDAPVE